MKKLIAFFAIAVPAGAPIAPANSCSEKVHRIGKAIASMENVRPALKNPGGLTYNGRLLRFRSLAQGEAAMLRAIERLAKKQNSLRELMKRWAPDGLPWYAHYVSRQTGIPLGVPICVE